MVWGMCGHVMHGACDTGHVADVQWSPATTNTSSVL